MERWDFFLEKRGAYGVHAEAWPGPISGREWKSGLRLLELSLRIAVRLKKLTRFFLIIPALLLAGWEFHIVHVTWASSVSFLMLRQMSSVLFPESWECCRESARNRSAPKRRPRVFRSNGLGGVFPCLPKVNEILLAGLEQTILLSAVLIRLTGLNKNIFRNESLIGR